MRMLTAVLVATSLIGPPRVSIRLSANVVMKGNSVQVICTVPRHPDNRRLYIGITDYTLSEIPIEGERGPTVADRWFRSPPCETERAFCELVDNADVHRSAFANLEVVGCTTKEN